MRRAEDIVQVISRQATTGFEAYLKYDLFHHFNVISQLPAPTQVEILKYFTISAVTSIEVFFRDRIATLIDSGDAFLDGAHKLATRHLRFDFDTVTYMHNKRLTLGQIIAHSIPLSSMDTICQALGQLTSRDFYEEIKSAHSLWNVRVKQQDPTPIIKNPSETFKSIKDLFEARHIIVHELPDQAETPFHGITSARNFVKNSLVASRTFLEAADEAISQILNPNPPLTQSEITSAAAELYDAEQSALSAALALLRNALKEDFNSDRLNQFNKSQTMWEEFCKSHAEFEADKCKGGTIWNTLYYMSAKNMIEHRRLQIENITWFVDRKTNDIAKRRFLWSVDSDSS